MILPPQKLSWADKIKRDTTTNKNNIEETIDYYISQCSWSSHIREVTSLFAAVEGYIDNDEYRYVQNPFNIQVKDGDPINYAAKLRNYNILKGIVNLLMGEFGRRSHEYSVTSFSETQENAYKDAVQVVIRDYYAQLVANKLMDLGVDVNVERKDLPSIDSYVDNFTKEYNINRSNIGQDAIDYCRFNCDLDSKFIDMYYDWIVTGEVYTYKTVNHDDVYYEHVPIHELYRPNEKHSRFLEDFSFVVRRQVLPIYKILDFFKGRVDDEFVEALDSEYVKGFTTDAMSVQLTNRAGQFVTSASYSGAFAGLPMNAFNGVELFHVQYKSFRQFGTLTYEDELGMIRTTEVADDYKLDKSIGDISIEWDWENEIIEGWKCLDFYLDVQQLSANRSDLNQEGLQKLSYNGISERSYTGEVQSIVKEGIPYQILVNSLHYQTEKIINKSKDKLLVMPYGLVPREKGMSTKDVMYHADATSVLWVDETAPNAQFAAQMIKSLDMGLSNYISSTIDIMKFVKAEYWEAIGMNAQRYSDIGERAGKGVTEQAIVRSAIITYELTRQFDKLIEKEYLGFLDISKQAWINGKKTKFIRSDGAEAFFELDEEGVREHTEASYGTFVMDSSLNTEAIQAIRGQAHALIQNGGQFSSIGKLYSTNSVSKITALMEKIENKNREYEEMVKQQEREAAQALQDSIAANDKENRDVEIYKSDNQLEGIKYTADKRAEGNSRNEPRPYNDLEVEEFNHKKNVDEKELDLKNRQLEVNKQKNKTK